MHVIFHFFPIASLIHLLVWFFSPLKTIRKILFHPCILAPTTLQAGNLIMVEETLGIEHYKKYIVVWNIWGFHSILNKIDVYSLGSFFSPAGISLWIKVYLITACTMEILGRNVCPRLVKSRGTATSSWNLEIIYYSYCRRGWIFYLIVQIFMELLQSFMN